jgi:hypothetical protein
MLLEYEIDCLSDDSLLALRTLGMHCPIRLCMGGDRQLLDSAENLRPLRFFAARRTEDGFAG